MLIYCQENEGSISVIRLSKARDVTTNRNELKTALNDAATDQMSKHMGDFVDEQVLLIIKRLLVNSYDALRLLATRDCVAENGIYIRRNDGKR